MPFMVPAGDATGAGPLDEIPFGAKDIMETRGLSTEYGSPIYKGRIGTSDAVIVRDELGTLPKVIGMSWRAAHSMVS